MQIIIRVSAAICWTMVGLTVIDHASTSAVAQQAIIENTAPTEVVTAAVPRSWPPYYMTDKDGKSYGFAIDTMNAIAKSANVSVQYRTYESFKTAMTALEEKAVDLVPNSGIATSRSTYARFTPPVERFAVSVFVQSGKMADLQDDENGLELLSGRTAAVVINNVGEHLLAKHPEVISVAYESVHEALIALVSGNVQALVYPQPVVRHIAASAGILEQIKVVGEPLLIVERAIAVRDDAPELHRRLASATEAFVSSKEYTEIYDHWLGATESFWTTRNVIAFGGIPMMLLLALVIAWRYVSVMRLNAELETRVHERTRELAQEKERAEDYLAIAGTMIVALDRDGKVTMINRKGCEVLGYEADEIIGQSWFETCIPQAVRAEVREVFAQIVSGNLDPVEHYENAVLAKDGSERHISWNNTFVSGANSEITGCLSAGEDVTERKRAVEALRSSETRFDQSQEFANIGTWDWNVQTGELYWSPRIAPLFGYAKGELETTYDNFLAAIHVDDRQSVIDAVHACVADGAEYNIEHRVVWPDGTVRWLLEKGDVVRDASGAPLNMLGVVQDITARKWAESEVQRLGHRNALILNAAGDGIYGVDLQGRGTFVNPATTAMLGFDADELIGQDLHKVIHHSTAAGEAYPEDRCPIYMAFKDGKERKVSDEVFWRKDGSSIAVEYTSTPIIEGGEIKGAVVVFRDVSERKQLQAQLIQSSKMATLGEMATGVAHELNQPLNVISMAVNNIKNRLERGTAEPDYLDDKLDKVMSQVQRAAAIIDHMRIFGRTPNSEMSVLNTEDMVDGSLSLIGEQLRLANIDVRKDMEAGEFYIRGHQVQIEQVLLNLFANAHDVLKGKEESDKRILVRIFDDAQAKQVKIEVEDSGGGIAPEHMTRIFEPFYTTKEIGKGTGLGLSISYGIVTEMGGTLTVRNGEKGACFTIALPRCEDAQAA
ncbi:MAG TPA: PAS domain S-box protein [Magnetovibrio sp.]